MDFEKAYKDALERARRVYDDDKTAPYSDSDIEYIFHELKESEDERIRKEMIEYFHGCIQRNKKSGFRVEQIKGWIAYLERQKEQKPAEWSEEDKKALNRAINICRNDFGEYSETAKFLKSLPKRFNLQPQQEWSEDTTPENRDNHEGYHQACWDILRLLKRI